MIEYDKGLKFKVLITFLFTIGLMMYINMTTYYVEALSGNLIRVLQTQFLSTKKYDIGLVFSKSLIMMFSLLLFCYLILLCMKYDKGTLEDRLKVVITITIAITLYFMCDGKNLFVAGVFGLSFVISKVMIVYKKMYMPLRVGE